MTTLPSQIRYQVPTITRRRSLGTLSAGSVLTLAGCSAGGNGDATPTGSGTETSARDHTTTDRSSSRTTPTTRRLSQGRRPQLNRRRDPVRRSNDYTRDSRIRSHCRPTPPLSLSGFRTGALPFSTSVYEPPADAGVQETETYDTTATSEVSLVDQESSAPSVVRIHDFELSSVEVEPGTERFVTLVVQPNPATTCSPDPTSHTRSAITVPLSTHRPNLLCLPVDRRVHRRPRV